MKTQNTPLTLRSIIEEFTFREMERTAALVDREGEAAVYCGYPAMEDSSNMMRGALIRNTAFLALHEYKAGDPHAEENFRRVNRFIHMLSGRRTDTWGKLSLLTALSVLADEGLLEKITPSSLEISRRASDYSDFLDKENLQLLGGKPTNYYHVAMACAAYREKLGFENEGMADRLCARMLGIMTAESSAGWSDEQPPFGRYDSYSVDAPGNIAIPLSRAGFAVPPVVLENLRKAAQMCLALRNPHGDGFPYGRSLAVHGDRSPAGVLMQAMQFGLLTEEEKREAVAYIARILIKIRDFWYDEAMGCINIWCGGRATDGYRNISRILEVNLDTQNSLYGLLNAAEKLGLADTPIPESDFGYTDGWQCTEIVFDETADKKRAVCILRRGDRLFTLPLIGGGSLGCHAVYLPFPACPRFTEAPPNTRIPFLTPLYTAAGGELLMPTGFYESVSAETGDDRCVITARGQMSLVAPDDPRCQPQPHGRFTAVYTFEGDRIRVHFDTDTPIAEAVMMYAGEAKVTGIGFAESTPLDVQSKPYHTAHGAPERGVQWHGSSASVGYEIQL